MFYSLGVRLLFFSFYFESPRLMHVRFMSYMLLQEINGYVDSKLQQLGQLINIPLHETLYLPVHFRDSLKIFYLFAYIICNFWSVFGEKIVSSMQPIIGLEEKERINKFHISATRNPYYLYYQIDHNSLDYWFVYLYINYLENETEVKIKLTTN